MSNMELSSLYKKQNILAKLYDKAKLGPKELETLSFEDWCKRDPGQKKKSEQYFFNQGYFCRGCVKNNIVYLVNGTILKVWLCDLN
jgi:hypothetical protein